MGAGLAINPDQIVIKALYRRALCLYGKDCAGTAVWNIKTEMNGTGLKIEYRDFIFEKNNAG